MRGQARQQAEDTPAIVKATAMGGGAREVHGAKLVGLLSRTLRDRPRAAA